MEHDMIVIGMGPAGMALSAMGSAMGLNVLAIEKKKIGGECLNCGCIPSKALLKSAYIRNAIREAERYGLQKTDVPEVCKPFERVQSHLKYINEEKTVKMFEKVKLIIGKGGARFVDSRTVEVDGAAYRARNIYICTGTMPAVPPIPGIDTVEYLTNENLFNLEEMPESMFIIGGGAIGSEMAQAFSRLGTKIVMAHMDPHLLPMADEEAARLLEEILTAEGIKVYNKAAIKSIRRKGKLIAVETDTGEFMAEKLLVAAGRKPAIGSLDLDTAGIRYDKRGIVADDYGRTNVKHVWAVGDCNGKFLLSHAAMHQGMLALMNSMLPFKLKFSKYVVPWSVFTEPEVAQVGMSEEELKGKGIKHEVIKVNYGDYGRTITDEKTTGFVKVCASSWGKIYGVVAIGESASEIIHEYVLAMHKNIRLHDIMLMQHAFPSVALLNKRIAEEWMMKKIKKPMFQRICQFMYRL
ncbi:MAG: NAD(P)/FAD-dependent oxidoreductase [Deltaproteobacteria bacterium]|nr:NAD(P)/FAD-dependent oxidoreductase [Deltaproteobacteria bacterium]